MEETLPGPEATAVGSPSGPPASGTIGARGGQLRTDDGRLTVDVPAGALAADTKLTIQPLTNLAPGGLGAAYFLGPAGQTFQKPVTLTFTYRDGDLVGSAPEALTLVSQTAERYWEATQTSRDAKMKTLTARTRHSSTWAYTTQVRLTPASAMVQEGKSLTLTVEICLPASGGVEDGRPRYSFTCRRLRLLPAQSWAVNGVDGGNDLIGRVSAENGQALYVAPGVAPQPRKVAVSVRWVPPGGSPLRLASDVTVVSVPPKLNATYVLDYSLAAPEYTESFRVEGTIQFKRPSGGPSIYSYNALRKDTIARMSNYVMDHRGFRCTLDGGVFSDAGASLALSFFPPGSYLNARFDGSFKTTCTSKSDNRRFQKTSSVNAQFGADNHPFDEGVELPDVGRRTREGLCEVVYGAAMTKEAPDRLSFPDSLAGRASYTCNTTRGRKTVTVSWTAGAAP